MSYLFALIPLVVAYLIYQVLFFILKKIVGGGLGRKIIDFSQKSFLFIFLELAAFSSLAIAPIPDSTYYIALHALTILLIATVGIISANIIRGVYRYLTEKQGVASLEDFSKRSLLTQMHILYRAIMFVVIVITFGAILMTFSQVRTFGIGILSSAGIAGLVLGIAARPILLNLMAGFQIAFTKLLKIGDVVVVEGEQGKIEQISLTHVVVKIWDLRRKIIPISYFIDKPFENLSGYSAELIAVAHIYCDYKTPICFLREKFNEILNATALWNKKFAQLDVIEVTESALKIRLSMSGANPTDASNLQNHIREKMMEFLQKATFPKVRYEVIEET